MIPKFRIVEFNHPQPETKYRFFIEWEIDVEHKFWFVPYKKKDWVLFKDPARLDEGVGYILFPEAKVAIDRYILNMQPTYHYL